MNGKGMRQNGAQDVAAKIDAAVSATEENPPLDGETFINEILERFKLNH